ncbi:hypothetical protein DPMN_023433 [Dreissena polymorpha]|uniref:Uncharacterized protein n=1 Tax=Dreissena polymorpha TaxID=45954 RepID=A0A9D4LMZ2_DREPO|nr:hypothetical protein DPMN_023433 [Dreissena polymorpha]
MGSEEEGERASVKSGASYGDSQVGNWRGQLGSGVRGGGRQGQCRGASYGDSQVGDLLGHRGRVR